MRRITDRIAKQHDLTVEVVTYWNGLGEAAQQQFYSAAVHDQRVGTYWEAMHGLSGQRGFSGRHASLADAASQAFAQSPQEIACRQHQDEEARAQQCTCKRCCADSPQDKSVTIGETSICFDCLTQDEKEFLGIRQDSEGK